MPQPTFGALLRSLRKRKGMTLVELSSASGVDNGNLSRIERGTRKPPRLPRLVALCKALGIEEDSPEHHELLAAAARGRFESFAHGGVTYFGHENPLHGLSRQQAPNQFTLTQAALEIGRVSASYGVKKITVEASDGSEWIFPIREPEIKKGIR